MNSGVNRLNLTFEAGEPDVRAMKRQACMVFQIVLLATLPSDGTMTSPNSSATW
jgi:hypothetical protein